MDWQTFTISILGSGVIVALMNHRTQIQAIKESGLYVKRAEVLDELMNKMERLDRVMGELISLFQQETTDEAENKRRRKAIGALTDFVGNYKKNRHYLPKKLSDEITVLCTEYKELFISFSFGARIPVERPDLNRWQELVKKQQGELAEKKEKVAEEFRKIIGVK